MRRRSTRQSRDQLTARDMVLGGSLLHLRESRKLCGWQSLIRVDGHPLFHVQPWINVPADLHCKMFIWADSKLTYSQIWTYSRHLQARGLLRRQFIQLQDEMLQRLREPGPSHAGAAAVAAKCISPPGRHVIQQCEDPGSRTSAVPAGGYTQNLRSTAAYPAPPSPALSPLA